MVRAAVMALALVVPVGGAQANYYYGEGPYIGFSVGATGYDLDIANANVDGSLTGGSVDDSDVGVKFFWGYRFSNNFGVELFYANLGEASYEAESTGVPVPAGPDNPPFWLAGTVGGHTKNTGYGLSAHANIPVTDFLDIFGKAGFYRWTVRDSVFNAVDNSRISDSGSDILYGGGLGLNITDRSAVRLEWERFVKVYDVYDIDLFSLGFVHKF